jgi:hypothetical protein
MPRSNGARLSEEQYIRMTINAFQLLFHRWKRIERRNGEFEAGKLAQACRKRCNDGPCKNTKTSREATISAKRCSRSGVRGKYSARS